MNEIIIRTEGISKKFDSKMIIEDANIEILKGETVAFIGENGSGKSTMLKLIAGVMKASSGKVIVNTNAKISYIPERFDKTNMTISEFISHMGRIDGLSKKEIDMKTEQLYSAFFLKEMVDTPMKFLSKGTLQKVAVIQAILIRPDILLLDEPLSGQDFASQKKFVELMLDFKLQGVTILMSCHEQFLMEQLADRIIKIENKKMIETTEFYNKLSLPYNLMIFTNNIVSESSVLDDIINSKGVLEIINKDNMIRIIIKKEYSQKVLTKMLQEGYALQKFEEI